MASAANLCVLTLSDAECAARRQLAACYRIFARQGWDAMISSYIALRVPGERNSYLINPFGMHYSDIRASNLVKIDIDGTVLDGSLYPVNKAGFVKHSAFHRNQPDAQCIIHSHRTGGMAVDVPASVSGGKTVSHYFEGLTIRWEDGAQRIATVGHNRVMQLNNDGVLVTAETLPLAFSKYQALQNGCNVQVAGAPWRRRQQGAADFATMVRMLERDKNDWKN